MKTSLILSVLLATGGVMFFHRMQPPPPANNVVTCELLKTRHLAVSAMINGHGPFRLIFDTGSPVVLLSSRVAKEAELHGPAQRKAARAAGALPGQLIVPSIELGDTKAENVAAVVMDHPTLKAIEGITGRIDGIIGYPFFARYKTTVDYSTLQITLEKSDYQPEDVMQSMMKALFDRNRSRKVTTISAAGQWGITVAKSDDDAEPGVTVSKVFSGTSAAAAGLRENDRLLLIDGRWTDSEDDCLRAAAIVAPGQKVEAVVVRNGQRKTLMIEPRAGF